MNTYSVALFLRKRVNFGKTATVKERLRLYIIPANSKVDAEKFGRRRANDELPGFEIKYFIIKWRIDNARSNAINPYVIFCMI